MKTTSKVITVVVHNWAMKNYYSYHFQFKSKLSLKWIWIKCWFFSNLSDQPVPIPRCFLTHTQWIHLSYCFDEYYVIITDGDDGQNHNNKPGCNKLGWFLKYENKKFAFNAVLCIFGRNLIYILYIHTVKVEPKLEYCPHYWLVL